MKKAARFIGVLALYLLTLFPIGLKIWGVLEWPWGVLLAWTWVNVLLFSWSQNQVAESAVLAFLTVILLPPILRAAGVLPWSWPYALLSLFLPLLLVLLGWCVWRLNRAIRALWHRVGKSPSP